jgi:septal ring factor EnvC (AmiA/AmiB activator)
MGVKDAQMIASSEYVFAILFILCLFIVGRWAFNFVKEVRDENTGRENKIFEMYDKQLEGSTKREEELMKNLNKNTEQLGNIADTLTDVQKNLSKLETKVDGDLKEVWKELGGKADKKTFIKGD